MIEPKKIKKTKKNKSVLAEIKRIQVQIATDPEFKQLVYNKENIGKKKTKITVKLKRKTTYYVRARYLGAAGVSKWSKVKKFRTK